MFLRPLPPKVVKKSQPGGTGHSGEIIMTVRMPLDTVDSEVYIKTPRGHSGIQMDPWMSSTWKRNWTTFYPPNRVTKDKLTKFRREKTQKHISLHKTAGRQQLKNHRCWSPRPNRRQNLPANHPSVRQCHLNKVRYRNGPRMEKTTQKDIQGYVTSWILV